MFNSSFLFIIDSTGGYARSVSAAQHTLRCLFKLIFDYIHLVQVLPPNVISH